MKGESSHVKPRTKTLKDLNKGIVKGAGYTNLSTAEFIIKNG